jgi:hypothetical protein
MVDRHLPTVRRFLSNPTAIIPNEMTQIAILYMWPKLLRLLGRLGDMNALFDAVGVGQSRADPVHRRLIAATGPIFCDWDDPPLSGKGMYTQRSVVDDVAAARVYFAAAVDADGRQTLDELAVRPHVCPRHGGGRGCVS